MLVGRTEADQQIVRLADHNKPAVPPPAPPPLALPRRHVTERGPARVIRSRAPVCYRHKSRSDGAPMCRCCASRWERYEGRPGACFYGHGRSQTIDKGHGAIETVGPKRAVDESRCVWAAEVRRSQIPAPKAVVSRWRGASTPPSHFATRGWG